MIDEYLDRLRRELRPWPARRLVIEVEDHLRAAAANVGDEEAVQRFGAPEDVAHAYARPLWSRLAALAVLALLLAYPALYPVTENNLPPAPWPADAQPSHLAWKQDAVTTLLLLAAGAASVGAARFRRGDGSLLVAAAVATAGAGAASILGVVLSFEWAEAVPGTPAWLPWIAFVHVALVAAAVTLLGRAWLAFRTAP